MSAQYYNLTFDSYKEKLRCGFSSLQQKEEFVDMTLAAEGYLVKVHKSIVALASPYLKEMISSIPCEHPVLFLNNIKYEILTLIVEYIYTGEIQVPLNILQTFLTTAQDLHLLGLNNVASLQGTVLENTIQNNISPDEPHHDGFVTETIPNLDFGNTNLDQHYTEGESINNTNSINDNLFESLHLDKDMANINNSSATQLDNQKAMEIGSIANITVNTDPHQYSVSSRGSLQLILNRFIYLMHHTSCKGFKRRWRCLDYRRKGCKAFIDTEGDKIMKRCNAHNHPYHDDKILKKAEKNLIYGRKESSKMSAVNNVEDNI